jgi:hypothetical protein
LDEYIRIGESTALESLRKFVAAVEGRPDWALVAKPFRVIQYLLMLISFVYFIL